MKPIRLVALWLAAMCIAGCASKLNDVRLGMSREEVVSSIGAPTSTSEMGDTVLLKYSLYGDWIFPDRYYVRLTGGKVDAFGRAGDFNLGY
jgi:hypothetical protein